MPGLRALDKQVVDAFAKQMRRDGLALRSTGQRLTTYGVGDEIARWVGGQVEITWPGGHLGEKAIEVLRATLPPEKLPDGEPEKDKDKDKEAGPPEEEPAEGPPEEAPETPAEPPAKKPVPEDEEEDEEAPEKAEEALRSYLELAEEFGLTERRTGFVFKGDKRWPIGDLEHAQRALVYILAGRGKPEDWPAVLKAVEKKWGKEPDLKPLIAKAHKKLSKKKKGMRGAFGARSAGASVGARGMEEARVGRRAYKGSTSHPKQAGWRSKASVLDLVVASVKRHIKAKNTVSGGVDFYDITQDLERAGVSSKDAEKAIRAGHKSGRLKVYRLDEHPASDEVVALGKRGMMSPFAEESEMEEATKFSPVHSKGGRYYMKRAKDSKIVMIRSSMGRPYSKNPKTTVPPKGNEPLAIYYVPPEYVKAKEGKFRIQRGWILPIWTYDQGPLKGGVAGDSPHMPARARVKAYREETELTEAAVPAAQIRKWQKNTKEAQKYAREKRFRILPTGVRYERRMKIPDSLRQETRSRARLKKYIDTGNNSRWLGFGTAPNGEQAHFAMATSFAIKRLPKAGFTVELIGYADPPWYDEPPAPVWAVYSNRAGLQSEESGVYIDEFKRLVEGNRGVLSEEHFQEAEEVPLSKVPTKELVDRSKKLVRVGAFSDDDEKKLRGYQKELGRKKRRVDEAVAKARVKGTTKEVGQASRVKGVGEIILDQLGGARRIMMMTGAKKFLTSKNSVQFKFPNKKRSKPNFVKVVLDPSDTYTVEFGRVSGLDYKKKRVYNLVYADQLRELFERETGLYLRF